MRELIRMKRWARRSRSYQTFEAVLEGALAQDHLRAAVLEIEAKMSREGKRKGMARANDKQVKTQFEDRNCERGLLPYSH